MSESSLDWILKPYRKDHKEFEELVWREMMRSFTEKQQRVWMAVYKNSTPHYFKGHMRPKIPFTSGCGEKVGFWGEWVLCTEVPGEKNRCNDCYKVYLLDQLGE